MRGHQIAGNSAVSKIVYLFETYGQSVAEREMLLMEFYNYCISDHIISH